MEEKKLIIELYYNEDFQKHCENLAFDRAQIALKDLKLLTDWIYKNGNDYGQNYVRNITERSVNLPRFLQGNRKYITKMIKKLSNFKEFVDFYHFYYKDYGLLNLICLVVLRKIGFRCKSCYAWPNEYLKNKGIREFKFPLGQYDLINRGGK